MSTRCLEALAVDDGGAALVVLLLGDPHLLEGGEGGQVGASDSDGVLPLGGSNDLYLYGGWVEGGDLLLHPVGNTGVHDGVVGGLVDAASLHSKEGRLEESLGAPE